MENLKNTKVENMISNSGNNIANQFIITTENSYIFQSYSTTMAIYDEGNCNLFLNNDIGNYSKTTAKYLKIFLKNLGIEYSRKNIEKQINEINSLDEFFKYQY